MSAPGHNGGPPLLDEEDAPKLRWAKVNIAEAIEGMEGLSMEERGFCWTGWLKMYARMGGFPADDIVGARIMGCDVRLYRRMLKSLGAPGGKFYVEDGLLKNSRVEREIAEFCREHRRRREAALEREAKRRLQVRSGELLPDFSQTSPGLLPEVSNMFSAPSAHLKEIEPKKPNEIIVCTATTVAQPKHSSGGTRTINQNQEPEREDTTTTEYDANVGGGDVLAALNGTAVDITRFISKFAYVDNDIARQMLGNNVRTFTSQAMLEAYAVTIAEMAEGLVTKPYKYMLEAARKIRDGAAKRSTKATADATPSRRDRVRKVAEEEEARVRGRA
jgi:hypothetical protein